MKILYIHTFYRQFGGEDIVFENEKKLMDQQGYEIDTVEFNNRNLTWLKFIFLFFNPVSFIRVYRKIKKFQPDIIHVHNWFFGASPSIFLAIKLSKVPVVHTLHNLRIICPSGVLFDRERQFRDSIHRVFPISALRKRVYRKSFFLTLWLLVCTRIHYFLGTWNSIDRLIALTSGAKKIISESYLHIDPVKIVVKPNFFQIEGFRSENLTAFHRNQHFLYVGRLASEKGIQLLMKVFEEIPYELRVIGDGPLRSQVEKSAGQHPNIHYLGFRQKGDIMEEMRSCTALVFPSIAYELFGLTIIEAFSCGTPVIASNSGSPEELVNEGRDGLLFQIGSASDLKEKLAVWLALPEDLKQAFYENAFQAYQTRYTADCNLLQLVHIYNSLLDEKRGTRPLSH